MVDVFIFLIPRSWLPDKPSVTPNQAIIHVTSEWVDSFITRKFVSALYGGHHKW